MESEREDRYRRARQRKQSRVKVRKRQEKNQNDQEMSREMKKSVSYEISQEETKTASEQIKLLYVYRATLHGFTFEYCFLPTASSVLLSFFSSLVRSTEMQISINSN